jgi:acetylornithine deacetylase/succinyl-diaminopimelate desuccinylase
MEISVKTALAEGALVARDTVSLRRCADLTAAMVRHDTRNPPGGESSIIPLLCGVLAPLGAHLEVFEPEPGRPSLIATIGNGNRPVLLINGHTDVVPVVESEWSVPPFAGQIHGDRLYGRGSCDMKGGIAAAVEGLRACKIAGVEPRCDVVFHLVADEETGGRRGTEALLRAGRIDAANIAAAIVPEPTEMGICVAERGTLFAEIIVHGRAAHGSDPSKGHSAVSDAAHLVNALHRADFGDPCHPLLGTPTCNVGTINGGTAPNIVASECRLRVDRRVLPGHTREQAIADLRRVIEATAARLGHPISYEIEVLAFVEASELDAKLPFVDYMRDTCAAPLTGMYGGTDARFLRNQLDIPTVVFGPGSMKVAHTADEYVPLDELHACATAFAAVFASFDPAELR